MWYIVFSNQLTGMSAAFPGNFHPPAQLLWKDLAHECQVRLVYQL
jgi:hypothetical protein